MIGIIYATLREAKPFMEQAGITVNSKMSYPFFCECKTGRKKIIFSISGIGISMARKCTVELFRRYTIQHVYNIGICGMINDNLFVNDLYCVSRALYWQSTSRRTFPCKPEFFGKNKHVTLATCNKPVFDHELRKKIAVYADIVDMEGAAIAEVCDNSSISCTLIKGVSDAAYKGEKKTLYKNIDSLSKRMNILFWSNLSKDK